MEVLEISREISYTPSSYLPHPCPPLIRSFGLSLTATKETGPGRENMSWFLSLLRGEDRLPARV